MTSQGEHLLTQFLATMLNTDMLRQFKNAEETNRLAFPPTLYLSLLQSFSSTEGGNSASGVDEDSYQCRPVLAQSWWLHS